MFIEKRSSNLKRLQALRYNMTRLKALGLDRIEVLVQNRER
jgi:hypothetical protein